MANAKIKIQVRSDGLDGFIRRGRARARALDSKAPLPSERIITFQSPAHMFRVLTPKRYDILQHLADTGAQSVSSLAQKLRRRRSAVSRDLSILSSVGAVHTASIPNTGHGRMTVASPVASRLEIVNVIGAAPASSSRT
jgi:predicted transcriptional regulator